MHNNPDTDQSASNHVPMIQFCNPTYARPAIFIHVMIKVLDAVDVCVEV